jgi:hypothetical protein
MDKNAVSTPFGVGDDDKQSQGQSIRVVGIDLTFECFAHGQLYVALSRASGGPHLYSNTSEESGLPNVVIYKES